MKRFLSLLLILVLFIMTDLSVFANSGLKVYAEKDENFSYGTITKKYQPYLLTFINNNKDTIYLTSKSKVEFKNDMGKVITAVDEEIFYKTARKKEIGRFCWVSLPSMLVGCFITGASFFLLSIPGVALIAAGGIPTKTAISYNSKLAQELYIDNAIPISIPHKNVKTAYVFLPKKENVQVIIITNLITKNSKPFDLEIPIY